MIRHQKGMQSYLSTVSRVYVSLEGTTVFFSNSDNTVKKIRTEREEINQTEEAKQVNNKLNSKTNSNFN